MSDTASPSTAPPLEIQARVSFGAAAEAFTLNVDLALPAHGVTALFGPSGCGKTTLLRAVAGLERPKPGRVIVSGDTWQDDRAHIWLPTHQRPLGYVFQEASLFSHLSVQGNLDFGLKRVPAGERRIALDQAIELLGIGHLLSRRPAQLSGGERQRVAIARALATSPRLLLMDEPLAALDSARKAELLPYFERLQRELTLPILYVSHALDEVAALASHLVLMEKGNAIASGTTEALLTRLDLPLAHGDNASAVVDAELVGIDEKWQLMRFSFAGGLLECVPTPGRPLRSIGERLRLRILARDVSITLTPAADTSVLNVVPVTVRALTEDGPAQTLVTVDAGGIALLARVTRKSAALLNLQVGQRVFAQVKGVAMLG